jgi:hypothetical protein
MTLVYHLMAIECRAGRHSEFLYMPVILWTGQARLNLEAVRLSGTGAFNSPATSVAEHAIIGLAIGMHGNHCRQPDDASRRGAPQPSIVSTCLV